MDQQDKVKENIKLQITGDCVTIKILGKKMVGKTRYPEALCTIKNLEMLNETHQKSFQKYT